MGSMPWATRLLHERGPNCRGLAVDRDGVVLGPGFELVRREGGGYRAFNQAETGLMLRTVFRDPGPIAEVLAKIADALTRGDLVHAQMLGLHTPFAALDLTPLMRRDAPLAKYDPDEPRVPAGDGRPSGEWTKEDASSGVLTPLDASGGGTAV